MRTIRGPWTLALLVAVVALLAVPAFTEEEAPGAPAAGDPNEWWQKMATPGEHHRWMDFMAGSWTTENKFWQGPGEPMTSTGKAETRWILEKHYLRSDYAGEMMGTPFTGEYTLAFSNATEEYQAIWIDSGSTGAFMATGKREGDLVTFRGKEQTHMGEVPTRNVITKVSNDEYTYETYWTIPNLGEFKVMELRYKRAE